MFEWLLARRGINIDAIKAQALLTRLRVLRDQQPYGPARSALNDACDKLDVAASKLANQK